MQNLAQGKKKQNIVKIMAKGTCKRHLPEDWVVAGHCCPMPFFCPNKRTNRKQINNLSESDTLCFVEGSNSGFKSLFVGAVNNGKSKDWTKTVEFGII